MSAAALAAAFVLSSCGGPIAPQLSVDQGQLGPYNALPTFIWSGDGRVRDAEYSLDGGASWTPLAPNVTSFQPDLSLTAGSYTMILHYRTWSGWSDEAQVSFTVTNVAISEPDDTYYADYQWPLPLIDMPLLWGLLDAAFAGDQDPVVVAVLDTGYLDHPDLIANINETDAYDFLTNYTIPSAGGYSRDGDGIDSDAHDQGDDSDDLENSWHGTSVAGNIAAVSDNANGIAGVARTNVQIMPVRVLGVNGGTTADIAQGVLYAAGLPNSSGTVPSTPAKIINMSLSGGLSDPILDAALEDVREAGVIVVAASGNGSHEDILTGWVGVGYPASSPYTIAVGAINAESEIAYYSQMGAEIDVVAPGGEYPPLSGLVLLPSAAADEPYYANPALQTFGYLSMQGTSMACPHVAGALAVLCTLDASVDLEAARQLLLRSSSELVEPGIAGLPDVGILNAAGLVEAHYGGRIASTVIRPEFNAARLLGAEPVTPRSLAAPSGLPVIDETTVDVFSLIVEFAASATPAQRSLSHVAGVQSVRDQGQNIRLVRLSGAPTVESLESTRQGLLADPAVANVYYNVRYYPQ